MAIPLEQAREIVHARQVTRLPGALPWVAGLFNLRGTVLTVLDVSVRLGGPASNGPVIVVAVEERSVGLRVDGVDAVMTADGEEVPVEAARSADGCVRASAAMHDGEALVLDVAALQRSALAEA